MSDWCEDYNHRRPHSALGDARRRVLCRVATIALPGCPSDAALTLADAGPRGVAARAPRPSPLRVRGYAARQCDDDGRAGSRRRIRVN
jgi:hypothetical protein